jgi:predicted Zn-dependent protease with MMP-like domain
MDSISNEQFEEFVVEGIDAIPERFAKEIDNVVIVVEDRPTPQQRVELGLRHHAYLFGLYQGIPKTKRWSYNMALPDKVTIFKAEIMDVARSVEHVRQMVINTVWHEIGHHFGLSDAQIHAIERKNKNLLGGSETDD